MKDQTALERAAKRLADINRKIEYHRTHIPRLPPGVRGHAEQILASYEATRTDLEAQYHVLNRKGA